MGTLFFLFILLTNGTIPSGKSLDLCAAKESPVIKIVFYNVENLFDATDDPGTGDDEFLPWGIKAWTRARMQTKLYHIARVLIGLGKGQLPDIIGVCEIEKRRVLEDLLRDSPLSAWPLGIVHFESPDHRGIDVALIYNTVHVEIIRTEALTVIFDNDTAQGTRDILYVKGCLYHLDTLHLFINHWPSRYGDYVYTSHKRKQASAVLRRKVDSVLAASVAPGIIIMGDFNDEPWDESVLSITSECNNLVNLMSGLHDEDCKGTIKYRSQWYYFDQFIVSQKLIPRCKVNVYKPDFLMMKDEKYFGIKPFRTYYGPKYLGGFSDHLPVYLELTVDN